MKKLLTSLLLATFCLGWVSSVFAAVDLHVTVNPDPVLPNGRLAYALSVTNTGSQAVTGVVVKDLFPEFVNVDYRHIPDGGTCPVSSCQTGERISWDLGTLAAHTSRTVRFEATVQNATVAGTVLDNLAELYIKNVLDNQVSTNVTVASGPGLELSIVDDRDPVVPGEQVTYTVVFGNRGANVLGVKLRAPLPVGTSFVSAGAGGSVVDGAVEWNLGTVLANASGERQFTVQVNGGAAVGDAVLAEALLVDGASSQTLVRAEDETALVSATPVELHVAVNPDPALPGEQLEYALTVTNTGSQAVTGVVVKDLFPEFVNVNYTLIPDGGTCPVSSCQTGERISWDIGTLAAHTSRTVRFEATVQNATVAGTVLDNLATLETDVGRATAQTAVPVASGPGLELSIVDDRDPVVPGEQVTYTVVFGNRGANVLGVKLRAPLPVGTSFVSAGAGGSVVDGAVEWNLGTVLANASGERQFTVQVNGGAAVGDAVLAEALLVDGASSQTLVRAEDETALVSATPVELHVAVNPDPALPGEQLEYALTVTNTGSQAVTGVVVKDLFPEFVNVNYTLIPDGGTCPVSSCQTGERISWDIGTLAAHTSRTVRFEATVQNATVAGTVLDNLATLTTDVGRATAQTAVPVASGPGLELSIVDDRDPVVPGEQVTYTVVFGNRGANVLGVKLRAPLPVGTSFVSAGAGGSVVDGAVEWNLGTVLANASGERQFTVQVNGGAAVGDAVLAEALLVDGASSQTLVRAEDETALVSATPVELHVAVNPDPALPGEQLEYALTVTNTGSQAVTGVVVKDLFPEFVNVNYTLIPDGGTCPVSSCQTGERISWDIGTLAAHTSRTVRFEATVQNATVAGTVLDNLATLTTDVGRATAQTAVPVASGPGLELSIVDDRDPVVPGEQVTYTVVFGNRSASTAMDLVLRAPLPVGTSFVSATAAGVLKNGVVEWDLGDRMIAGGVDIRHFTVHVNGSAAAGDAVQAEALLVDGITTQSLARTRTVTALEGSPPPVRLTSALNIDPDVPDEINYTLTVTNTSGLPVTGVVVKDLFPEFVNVNYSTGIQDGGTCPNYSCNSGERISWDVGSLAAGAVRLLRYTAVTQNSLKNGTVLRNRATLVHDTGAGSSGLDLGHGIVIDSDEDGLPDSWELSFFGNLNQTRAGDFDNDNLNNLEEYYAGTNPNDKDTDNDGMPDGYEVANGFNPLSAADAGQDADGDGLTNLKEFQLGTKPRDSDSDADGMPDKYEVDHGFDPLSAADAAADADGDGYSNLAEFKAGSNPLDPKSIPRIRAMPWLPLLLK